MWDRFVNFVYNLVRDMSNTAFFITIAAMFVLGFYFLGNFLKANKKEEPKVAKISQLLISIMCLVGLIVMFNIR